MAPTPTSVSWATPIREVKSSGAELPAAMNVAPATSSESFSFSEITSRAGTKKSSHTTARPAGCRKWNMISYQVSPVVSGQVLDLTTGVWNLALKSLARFNGGIMIEIFDKLDCATIILFTQLLLHSCKSLLRTIDGLTWVVLKVFIKNDISIQYDWVTELAWQFWNNATGSKKTKYINPDLHFTHFGSSMTPYCKDSQGLNLCNICIQHRRGFICR